MRPPGTRLRAVAARLFAANTMDYLIDPAIADMQAEYEEASRRGTDLAEDAGFAFADTSRSSR